MLVKGAPVISDAYSTCCMIYTRVCCAVLCRGHIGDSYGLIWNIFQVYFTATEKWLLPVIWMNKTVWYKHNATRREPFLSLTGNIVCAPENWIINRLRYGLPTSMSKSCLFYKYLALYSKSTCNGSAVIIMMLMVIIVVNISCLKISRYDNRHIWPYVHNQRLYY